MAYLFDVVKNTVVPTTTVLLISPFKEIWENNSKDKAIAIFSYIEFMASHKKTNPYKGYPPQRRKEKLIEKLFPDGDFVEDDLIKNGIRQLEEFQTEASEALQLYIAVQDSIFKAKVYYDTLDLSERDKTGKPVHKMTDYLKSIKELSSSLGSLKSLREKVEEDLYEESKYKGGKKVGHFAKLESIKKQ